jgi:SAM-dependent methyltransferase
MQPKSVSTHLQSRLPSRWNGIFGGVRAASHLQYALDQLLPECFGYYGITLGPLADQLSLAHSPVRNWFRFDRLRAPAVDAIIEYDALPIASDTIDVAVVPHLLDFVEEPHQLLRELERVIIPDGKVIISGINPLSLYGGRELSRRLLHKKSNVQRMVGLSRIKDWMMLLGFSIEHAIGLDTRTLDVSNPKVWQPFTSHFHSHYLIMAKKCVSPITPIRPSWRGNRKLVPARFAEPSIRQLVDKELKKSQR